MPPRCTLRPSSAASASSSSGALGADELAQAVQRHPQLAAQIIAVRENPTMDKQRQMAQANQKEQQREAQGAFLPDVHGSVLSTVLGPMTRAQ